MRAGLVWIAALALVVAACSNGRGTITTSAGSALSGELFISAAASLTYAFTELGEAFTDLHPELGVVFNFGPSSGLRDQIIEGAPADVFASANTSNMDQLAEAKEVDGQVRLFARNLLQIAVPAGNEAVVTGLADLARDDLLVGLCAEEVPCGSFARQALENAGVTPSIDTNETDVRSLLTKIAEGELDAGITYVTDVMSADDVEGVDIPAEHNVIAEYQIAVLARAPNPEAAAAFVEFILSAEGQRILGEYGFASP